jgi:uncharacterized protein (TIGR02284 family)
VDTFDVSKRHAEKIAMAVHRCISACADGEKGYALAASAAHDEDLRAFFETSSKQRAEFAAELRGMLVAIGVDGDGVGTALGMLHRAAVDVRMAMTGKSDLLLLEECDRGEASAQHHYEVARSELVRVSAPKPLRHAIDAQYVAVCNARYEIGGRLATLARNLGVPHPRQ